jgi:threonine dehydrogenase-like Zn-dependent dehydrogenase/predicted dehydrogenase
MKQIVQSYKTGAVETKEVTVPLCRSNGILVKNMNSLVSIGTERLTIELGKKSLIGKAAARPDLLRRAIDKAKKEGFFKTWQEAMGRLDIPTPLGYSSSGIVCEVGIKATEFSPGDRVVCVGQGFASHAEFVYVSSNLAVKLPSEVTYEEAAFGMLGIIALHGIRCGNLSFGSKVAVMGLGLLGLLTVQILKAYGCQVYAIDPSPMKTKLAKKLGADKVENCINNFSLICDFSSMGHGVDSVFVTAATNGSEIIDSAISLCRSKGKIVVVGTADIHPDRNELWKKEIELVVSRAAGPGSLNPSYEQSGIDFPIEDVRWTLKRNLQEFIRLISEKKIDVKSLITHRFKLEEAELFYKNLTKGNINEPIGVILQYKKNAKINRSLELLDFKFSDSKLRNIPNVVVIGAGLFAKALFLPALKKIKNINLHTLITSSGYNAEHNGKKFGFANQSTDEKSIWKLKKIDVIIGLTPHSSHARLVKSAIINQKNIFLEKPLCISKEELFDIEKVLIRKKQLPLIMIGHNRRFSPHTFKILEWMSGRLSPAVIIMRINAGYIPSTHWVHSAENGRSRIVGEMSHFIDLIQAITKSKIVKVSAERVSNENEKIVNNDNIIANLKFQDGSIASLIYSSLGDKSYSRESTEIFFDEKIIKSEDFSASHFFYEGKKISFKTSGQQMGYVEELDYFFSCLKDKSLQRLKINDLISTMKIVFAIEDSLATGKSIEFSTNENINR